MAIRKKDTHTTELATRRTNIFGEICSLQMNYTSNTDQYQSPDQHRDHKRHFLRSMRRTETHFMELGTDTSLFKSYHTKNYKL